LRRLGAAFFLRFGAAFLRRLGAAFFLRFGAAFLRRLGAAFFATLLFLLGILFL